MQIDRTKVECLMANDGLGMMALAEKCGVTHKTLKRALDIGCNPKTCGKIAAALGVESEVIVKKETTVQ